STRTSTRLPRASSSSMVLISLIFTSCRGSARARQRAQQFVLLLDKPYLLFTLAPQIHKPPQCQKSRDHGRKGDDRSERMPCDLAPAPLPSRNVPGEPGGTRPPVGQGEARAVSSRGPSRGWSIPTRCRTS